MTNEEIQVQRSRLASFLGGYVRGEPLTAERLAALSDWREEAAAVLQERAKRDYALLHAQDDDVLKALASGALQFESALALLPR